MTNEEFIQSIALPGEEWRIVPDWNRYMVSSEGRILALSAPYRIGEKICRRKPQLLRPIKTNSSPHYLRVRLSNGERIHQSFLVHRLVASAFIPNTHNLPCVNHKDENAQNNRAANLEWCTQQYNCNYGTHNARMAETISRTAYQKRKVVQLSLNGNFISQYDSIQQAANALGIERASISICCRKPNRTGRGYKWIYLSDYESQVSMSKNSDTES